MQVAIETPPPVTEEERTQAVRKVQKARIDIMRSTLPSLRMWGGVMTIGNTVVDDSIPTACTNGRDEWYGTRFVLQLKPKEMAFVVLHEGKHKALRHLTTYKAIYKENPKLANAACDYVINLMIVDADPHETVVAMPRNPDGTRIGLLDERFRGMNSKQVFDILKDEQEQGGGSGGEGFDDHDWEGAQEIDGQEAKELEQEIDRALRQGAMEAKKLGQGAGGQNLELKDLLEPQIDWREVLREFVTSTCANKDTSSWRKVNRRFIGQGIYLPSLIGESVGKVAVGIDTSGSISQQELSKFMSEVVSISDTVTPDCVDLIYWDSEVAGHEQYFPGDYASMVQTTKPKGGGGTDPRCMEKYLKDNKIEPECIIMLTDGYVPSWGDNWPAPILWVVLNNPNATATCGKTTHIR